MGRVRLVLAGVSVVAAGAFGGGLGAGQAGAEQTAPVAPDSFFVQVSAAPLLIQVSAPVAVPFEIEIALAYSSVKLDNSPLVVSEAGPVHVPLVSGLGLLGGTESLGPLIKRLLPDIVVGLPRIIGLEGLPLDASKIPVPDIDIKGLPELYCTSFFPGDPRVEDCALPGARLLGFELGSFSGRTATRGDPADVGSVSTDASASFGGFRPGPGAPSLPIAIGGMSSSASARVVDGRLVARAELTIEGIDIAGVVNVPKTTASIEASLGGTADTASVTQHACTLSPGAVPAARAAGEVLADEVVDAAAAGKPDLGSGQLVRSVGKEPVLGADGSTLTAATACLDGSWSIPTSGTKIRIALGEIKLEMSAAREAKTTTTAGNGGDDAPGTVQVAQVGNLRPIYAGFMALTIGVLGMVSLMGGRARPALPPRGPGRQPGPRM